MDNLKENFDYFKRNHKKLYKEYPNMFIVIKDKHIVLSSDSFESALAKAAESGLELGTFLVQRCTADESGFTQTFHSRVIFA